MYIGADLSWRSTFFSLRLVSASASSTVGLLVGRGRSHVVLPILPPEGGGVTLADALLPLRVLPEFFFFWGGGDKEIKASPPFPLSQRLYSTSH